MLGAPTGYPLPPAPMHRAYAARLPDFLVALAADPAASLAEIAQRAGISRSYAAHMASYGRRTLGLRSPSGTNRWMRWDDARSALDLIEDEARYRAWCDHLFVQPWPAPTLKPEITPEPDAPITLSASLPDVRAALPIFREAMAREGVESIQITASSATITRRVVITETLE